MSRFNTSILLTAALVAVLVLGGLSVFSLNETLAGSWPMLIRLIAWVAFALTTSTIGLYIWESRTDHDLRLVAQRVKEMAERSDARGWVAIRTLEEPSQLVRAFESLRQHLIDTLASDVKLRAEAEVADRYKTEFLTAISHELRTPLNGILGFTEVLLAETDGPLTSGQRENLETIRSAGEHLLSLFNDVIDLSAMASGRIRLRREDVAVAPVFGEVGRLLEGQRGSKDVRIRSTVLPIDLTVHADPKRLRQILTNLGTNALKFTEHGEVEFRAELDGDDVLLSVRDTGVGIAPADLAAVFEEYTQTGDARRRHRGSGLGLGICKRLTDLHGGRIWVESEPGKGSTFFVSLSRTAEAS